MKKRLFRILKIVLFLGVTGAVVGVVDQAMAGTSYRVLEIKYIIHVVIWMLYGAFLKTMVDKKVI